jgi:hypothetical protein
MSLEAPRDSNPPLAMVMFDGRLGSPGRRSACAAPEPTPVVLTFLRRKRLKIVAPVLAIQRRRFLPSRPLKPGPRLPVASVFELQQDFAT